MEQKTVIDEFRKLEEEFGTQKAQLIMDFTMKYAELLTKNISTKDDLHSVETGLRKEISNVETGLRKEISNVEIGLRKEISNFETGLRKEISNFETGLRKEISNISWKLAGFLIAQAVFIVTLIKLLGLRCPFSALLKAELASFDWDTEGGSKLFKDIVTSSSPITIRSTTMLTISLFLV